jgi:hypothetical protein
VTSTTLSAPRRAALAVALALLTAAPAAADAVRWSHPDSTASARLASGPSTWVAGSNIKRTSGLALESWWGNDSSWNRYAYVENNPVNATDPDGELGFLATALVGGLVDAGFQVAINAIEGKSGAELLEGTGKAFVRGAVIGATGYGLAKLGARALEVGQAARQVWRAQRIEGAADEAATGFRTMSKVESGSWTRPARGETRVTRWMSKTEAEKMRSTGTLQTGAGDKTYVTDIGAPKPGGTGPVRVDFNVPTASLQPGSKSGWYQILSGGRSVPPVNGIVMQ